MTRMYSALADRTEERRSARLHDPLDSPPTAAARAAPSFPVVDPKVIATPRPIRERIVQGLADGTNERAQPAPRRAGRRHERLRRPRRRQPRTVQRLAHVDVAEAGDDPLVQQGALEGGAFTPKRGGQGLCGERLVERLGSEAEYRGAGVIVVEPHRSEPPRIVEHHGRTR